MNTKKPDRIWQNLLSNQCPMCGLPLHDDGDTLQCGYSCGFFIAKTRAAEITRDIQIKNTVMGVERVLPSGKIKFKTTKTFKGPRPASPLPWLQKN